MKLRLASYPYKPVASSHTETPRNAATREPTTTPAHMQPAHTREHNMVPASMTAPAMASPTRYICPMPQKSMCAYAVNVAAAEEEEQLAPP